MTACESSGYTGASFSHTGEPSFRSVTLPILLWLSSSMLATLLNNIPASERYPLPVNRHWCCFSLQGFDQTPKKGPFSVLFLSLTLICVSPHIGKRLR